MRNSQVIIVIQGLLSVTLSCSTSTLGSGTEPEASGPKDVSAVPAAAAPTAPMGTGQPVPQATLPPDGDDWSNDPDAIGVDYYSLTALEADVEQPECTAALGTDCGPPIVNGIPIVAEILNCKDRRQCNGEWHLRCKLFGICLKRQSKGGCENHPPDQCTVTAPNAYDATGTGSATINYRSLSFKLRGGQTISMGTCGESGSSATGDTFLRLFRGANEVASNDDACGGVASHITYTAPVTGTYTVRMGCYADTSCTGALAINVTGTGTGGGELGRIGMWGGKVNIHRAIGGAWTTDADCSSGADLDLLTYCRKFFPATTWVSEAPLTSKPSPVWYDAGCSAVYGGDGVSEYTCERGSELGRIGYWWGKVNIHLDASGAWQPDSDCTSGANIDPLTYCRKFWPSTASVAPVELTAKPTSVWYTGGCGTLFGGPGVSEFICVP